VILVQDTLPKDKRATTTRELLFRSMSKTSEDGVVSLVPDGLLITTPITSGVPLCPGSPLIQRQGLAKKNYGGVANCFESATYDAFRWVQSSDYKTLV
jgi:hypothetical protein